MPSLLGFNIGVELGQAAIILMVFPMLFIVRRTRYYVPFMYIGSVVLAAVALGWATERIFEYNLRVNDVVDPLLRWPRSALLVVAGYAIAIAVRWYEQSRGRLLPVYDASLDADSSDPSDPSEAAELVDA